MAQQKHFSSRVIEGTNMRAVMSVMLLLGGLLIAWVASYFGLVAGLVVSLIPIALFIVFGVISNPYWGLMLVFTVNYFIMGLTRYMPGLPVGGGQIMDLFLALTIVGVIIVACQQRIDWVRVSNGLTAASALWMVYCTLEIFNLEGPSLQAWFTSVRGVAFYFFILSVITPILFGHVRDMRRILYMWSVFTLVAVGKAYMQKNFGFDPYEMRWLYVDGGRTTHLIGTGIRFFSIYTDAANFGAGMGFAMVTFSIVSFSTKNLLPKLYFLAVAGLAFYGMMISGTRGAIAVPFTGYAMYILISRNWRVIIAFSMILVGAYFFLNHTMYLHGNTYVRRMRSAFDPNDPSLVVRIDNQAKMKVYMKSRPFGVGIGMGGGKAKDYAPHAYMSQIPTDSWFVMIWAETGIVGLLLYIAILVYLLIRCAIIIMFKIKNRQLRNTLAGMLSGVFGIMVSSYGNEILGQFPTGFILYILLAFIFMGPEFDRQIAEMNHKKALADGTDQG